MDCYFVTGCRERLRDRLADATGRARHQNPATCHQPTLASGFAVPPVGWVRMRHRGEGGRMPRMTQQSSWPAPDADRPVRGLADAYVLEFARLDPLVATMLGLAEGQDELPDLSPAGYQARDELRRATQAQLIDAERAAEATGSFANADERRCARLLTERLETELAVSRSREHLRTVSNIFGPPQAVRGAFLLMPTATAEDWSVISRRIGRVPAAFANTGRSPPKEASLAFMPRHRKVRPSPGQSPTWSPQP